MNTPVNEETISLQDLFKVLKKRLSLIVSITLIAMIISAVISFYMLTPIYESSTQILVNQQKTDDQGIETQDIQTNLQLINTYNVIIKSPAILTKVIEQLDLDLTPAQLSGKITVANAENSQVVSVTVQDEQAFMAVDIANTVADVFQKEIKTLMNVDNVNILSPAVLSENPAPVKPNKMLNVAIAMVIGLMLSVGLAFLLEYLDTSIKSEQDIEEILNLPIIGLVSPIPEESSKQISSSREKLRNGGRV